MIRKQLVVSLLCCFAFSTIPCFSDIEEEVQVNLIEIWAKVTDKNGGVVTDLRPEDFQIYIDGKKMEIRCFDRTFPTAETMQANASSDQGEPAEVPPDKTRKFIFFFDLLNSTAHDIDFLKTRVSDFLKDSFQEGDQGMVFVLLPSVKLGVVQKMTDNKEALLTVIQKVKGNPALETKLRNNETELLHVLYPAGNISGANAAGGQAGANSRVGETIRIARSYARTLASQERNLSKITLNSFISIADYLADNSFPGRLVMMYVSGGFPLRPGESYFNIVNKAIEDTFVVGSEDLVFRDRADNDFENEVRNTIGILNRLNVTIYAVDSNGLVEPGKGAERDAHLVTRGVDQVAYVKELQDSLAMIARETGGMLFSNSQNYPKGLAMIAADMNQQYGLCSSLPSSKKHGTYHKIDVKVAKANLKVRHRKGYYD